MTSEHARVMARYNRWMNDKLYAVAEKLGDEERKKDRGAFFGSIHRTLNHLLLADRVWLGRFVGVTLPEGDMGPRGIRTLDARIRIHEENAGAIANALHDSPAVSKVYYPGLPWHPGHEIAASQQNGFGGMVSFELEGGVDAVEKFLASLECFTLAESLGGVESLVAHPATMTHAAMEPAARETAGITDSLLRLSVGIEHVEDLVFDLRQALAQT